MKSFTIALLFTAVAALFLGCSAVNDPYVGEYSSDKDGEAFIKVVKTRGEYGYSTLDKGKWDKPRPLRLLAENEYQNILSPDCKKHVAGGIATEIVVLLRVKEGVTCANKPFESDYMFITFLGVDFLHKIK